MKAVGWVCMVLQASAKWIIENTDLGSFARVLEGFKGKITQRCDLHFTTGIERAKVGSQMSPVSFMFIRGKTKPLFDTFDLSLHVRPFLKPLVELRFRVIILSLERSKFFTVLCF